MKRVTGIGGIFYKSNDPKKAAEWYDKHLGLNFGANTYQSFLWRDHEDKEKECSSVFSFFKKDSSYFKPSDSSFMINFRVNDLDGLLQQLKAEGVQIVGETEVYPYGKFNWIIDPDGNKIELWEPID
jgi:predicted enzyme related to lactoylglutathione lyase